MKSVLFRLLAGRLGNVIGRRNLAKTGAFLMRAGRQDIPNSIAMNGEALVQKTVLSDLERKESIVIDCGANIGQWSTQLISIYRKLGGESHVRVFCFEPSSYTYAALSAVLEKLQSETLQFTAIQTALSNQRGSVSLKIVHEGAGSNSVVGAPGSYASEESVTVTTLDEFAKQNDLSQIDFLKIDAEGHDFDVILGAEKLLNEMHISVIQFEYNWRWIYGKHFLQEVFQFLSERGYTIGKITPDGIQFYPRYDVKLESFIEGNYLACTNTWKGRFRHVPSWFE